MTEESISFEAPKDPDWILRIAKHTLQEKCACGFIQIQCVCNEQENPGPQNYLQG